MKLIKFFIMAVVGFGCWGYQGLYYKGDEYKNTYFNLRTKEMHFGVPITSDFFIFQNYFDDASRYKEAAPTVTIKVPKNTIVTSIILPDTTLNSFKNEEVYLGIVRIKDLKELYRYQINKSDWLDTAKYMISGTIAPYQ
jgi:hypothetical protein